MKYDIIINEVILYRRDKVLNFVNINVNRNMLYHHQFVLKYKRVKGHDEG